MNPTLKICLAEQARQHALANNSFLPNVRRIAAAAEEVWRKEAEFAKRREARGHATAAQADGDGEAAGETTV